MRGRGRFEVALVLLRRLGKRCWKTSLTVILPMTPFSRRQLSSEKVFEGFTPTEVFNVAARRDIWDSW